MCRVFCFVHRRGNGLAQFTVNMAGQDFPPTTAGSPAISQLGMRVLKEKELGLCQQQKAFGDLLCHRLKRMAAKADNPNNPNIEQPLAQRQRRCKILRVCMCSQARNRKSNNPRRPSTKRRTKILAPRVRYIASQKSKSAQPAIQELNQNGDTRSNTQDSKTRIPQNKISQHGPNKSFVHPSNSSIVAATVASATATGQTLSPHSQGDGYCYWRLLLLFVVAFHIAACCCC